MLRSRLALARRRDAALSDIVGTSVVLAVTVIAVGAAAVSFGALSAPSSSPPSVDIAANATASATGFVTIQHVGGATLPTEELEVVLSSTSWTNASRLPLRLAGPGPSFDLGVSAFVEEAGRPLNAGDHVDVLIYLKDAGALIASTSFVVVGSSSTPSVALDGFLVTLRAPSGPITAAGGSSIYVSAEVVHPSGRKAIERAVLDLTALGGAREARLLDDGTLGDETASDGVYSGFVLIPPQAPPGNHTLRVQAYDLDANHDNSSAATSFTLTVTPTALSTIQSLISQFENTTVGGGFNGLPGATGLNGIGSQGPAGSVVNLTGPQGAPGATGATGATGGNGTMGSGGPNGTAGSGGATGANGTDGANGTGGFVCCGPAPAISGMDPDYGPAGTIVQIAGERLVNLSSVLLAPEGASFAYLAAFAMDPSTTAGGGLIFAVPAIPDGDYVVNVTRIDGAWATAPTTFRVAAPQPEIASISPPAARSYTQVNVTGKNFTSVTSVTLTHPSLGEVAVPWSVLSSTSLVFVTHPGLVPGIYDVNISTGLKWAIAPLAFEALVPLQPEALALTPSTARAEDIVTITGSNLDTVTRVVLNQTNDSRIIDGGWYLENGAIKLMVPTAAAPGGPWSLTYDVDLTGSFVGTARVPEKLTVEPTPPPTLTSFTPARGEPFTQVNIFGSQFVNVRSVTFGEVAVYFTEVSSHQILAVTHAGLPAGNYTINVSTATGYARSATTFEALPLKLVPVYNKTIFSYVGATLNASSGTNNDQVQGRLKFQLNDPSWTVTAVTFNPVNFEPQSGSNPYTSMAKVCGPTSSNVQTWALPPTSLHAYLSPANELDFVFGVRVNLGGGVTVMTYIFTTDETRNFILPAGQGSVTVLDHGEPTNGFANCS